MISVIIQDIQGAIKITIILYTVGWITFCGYWDLENREIQSCAKSPMAIDILDFN